MSNVLKRSLNAKKGWVTRLSSDCESLIESDQLSYNKLKRRVDRLQEKWCSYTSTYEALEAKLLEKGEEESYDELSKAHDEFESQYRDSLETYENQLDGLTNWQRDNQIPNLAPKIVLPNIQLPEFSGNISEWPSFWDKFNGLIHQRTDIPDINKFSYLLGQLKSNALSLVSSLEVIATNYEVALGILQTNYEDKDLFTDNLVQRLLDVASPNYNLKELQSFRITVNSTLESLRQHHEVDRAEWLLRVIIQRKLPKKVMETLYLKYRQSHFSLKEVDDTLLDLCKYLQREEDSKSSKVDHKPPVTQKRQTQVKTPSNFPKPVKPPRYPSASQSSVGSRTPGVIGAEAIGSYTTSVNKNPTKSSRVCIFCSAPHSAVSCDQFKGSNQRKQRLAQLGRCTTCLSSYHLQAQCNALLRQCFKCKEGVHHIVLCSRQDEASPPSQVSQTTQNPPNAVVCPAAVPVAEVTVKNKE